MRDEMQKAIGNGPLQQPQQQPNRGAKANDNGLSLNPLGSGFDAPTNPAVTNKPINGQLQANPLATNGANTEQGTRMNVLGAARRTSTQYAELNKRLEQYYADRRNNGAEAAAQYNADMKAKLEKEKAGNKKPPLPGTDAAAGGPPKPGAANPANPPRPGADTEKPNVKKPQPLRITTLAQGVKGERWRTC